MENGVRKILGMWKMDENGYDPWRWVLCHDFCRHSFRFLLTSGAVLSFDIQNFGPWFFGTSLRLLELKSTSKNHWREVTSNLTREGFADKSHQFGSCLNLLVSCWLFSLLAEHANPQVVLHCTRLSKDDVTLYMCQSNELKLSQIYPSDIWGVDFATKKQFAYFYLELWIET